MNQLEELEGDETADDEVEGRFVLSPDKTTFFGVKIARRRIGIKSRVRKVSKRLTRGM